MKHRLGCERLDYIKFDGFPKGLEASRLRPWRNEDPGLPNIALSRWCRVRGTRMDIFFSFFFLGGGGGKEGGGGRGALRIMSPRAQKQKPQ